MGGCFSGLVEKLLVIQAHFCETLESRNSNFGLRTTFAQTEPHVGTEKRRHPHFETMHYITQKEECPCKATFQSRQCQGLPVFSSLLCSNAYQFLCVHSIALLSIPLRIPHSPDSYNGDRNIQFVVPFIYASTGSFLYVPQLAIEPTTLAY